MHQLESKLRGCVFEDDYGYLIIIGNQHLIKGNITVKNTGKLISAKDVTLEDISEYISITPSEVVIILCSNPEYIYISK